MRKIKKEYFIIALFTLVGLYGVDYISNLAGKWDFSFSVISILVLGTLLFLLWNTYYDLKHIKDVKDRKKRIIYAFVLSFLFSATMIIGYQLKTYGMTESGFRGKGLILIRSFCLAVAAFPFSNILFKGAEYLKGEKKVNVGKEWKNTRIFIICWIIIFLSFIPVLLAYYPVIMSYDFHRQSQEAMRGFIWFNAHHPLIHTWLIWLFLRIGESFGSYETGLACYSIFQMLVVSVILSYSCVLLYRIVRKKCVVVAALLFYGLFPFNSVLVVCTTKDILFGALFLLFLLLVIERTFFTEDKKKTIMTALLVLVGILMIMFRNNAVYAILAFSPFYILLSEKKERLKILIICVLLIVGGRFALEGMQVAIGTQIRGSESERYSVLIQQFTRVGYYHKDMMDEATYELLDTYVSADYWERYNPSIADSVKALVAVNNFVTHWKGNMGEVIKDWAKLGIQYPNEYMDAFLCLTAGYWFWDDVTYAEVLGHGLEDRMGVIYTYNSSQSDAFEGVEHISKFPWLELKLEEIVSANRFYDWPVISSLFKAAFYCWLLLILFLLLLYNRRKRELMVCLFPLFYLATLFLGPVVQIRYIYPIIIALPVLISFLWMEAETNKKES